jgi:hypothetical protein
MYGRFSSGSTGGAEGLRQYVRSAVVSMTRLRWSNVSMQFRDAGPSQQVIICGAATCGAALVKSVSWLVNTG